MAGLTVVSCGLQPRNNDRSLSDELGRALEETPDPGLPTLWIAGDSTVKCNFPMRGWGQDLGSFFDPKKIHVVNRAIGGRSSRTFYTEGRWQEIVDGLKPGDFVIIQFGHNDISPLDGTGRLRGSLKGIGNDVEKVVMPDGRIDDVNSFGWYLKTFARSAKAKGAQVILCSPVPRLKFTSQGGFQHDWHSQREWISACARAEGAAYIALEEIIARTYESMDRAAIENLFADHAAHTNADGALINARSVVTGLKRNPALSLGRYLNEEGMKIAK